MTILRRTRARLTLADQAANRYPAFPFEVPPDAQSIGVSMEVDRADGRACIDLGLLGPDGLRGWSGGARTSYVVERDDATPGYRPGLTDLLGSLDVLDDTGHPLQPNGGPASPDPTLWFAGMRPNLVSYFWGAARDGAEIAREIAGRKKRLPSRVKAQRDTTAG